MARLSTTQPIQLDGRLLSQGQLRQLQWIVPRPWSAEVVSALATLPLAGARARTLVQAEEHWIGFFDGVRMVEEALRPAAYPLLSERGLLPIAGCGRRGASLYFVDVTSPESTLWFAEESAEPRLLGLGLRELWAGSRVETRVQLRRRLPEKSPRRLAKTTASARPSSVAAACKRTLPLFA
jgi:hypothetical protein